ncbi:glycosyltransferase [Nonomuraea rosea]|uniref:Glycosyltransferase n=1 Tax=Nonomuraea rosea TaxID=638574 RepID=A0ABP6ZPN0_9ACTN
MTDIIVASTPVNGHVSPLLTAAADLVRRGHEVTFLTGARFEARVRGAGARFAALPEEADYDDQRLDLAFPERGTLPPGPEQIDFDLKHIFGDPVPAQYGALRRLLAEIPATSVISDNLFLGALSLTLEAERDSRPTTIALGIAPPTVPDDWNRDALAGTQEHLEKIFASVGTPLPGFILDNLITVPDHYVQLTVPGFEYPWDGAPVSFQFAGPLPQTQDQARPLPDWWSELSAGRPVVVVTQGTFANSDLEQLVVPTLRALADSPVLVVATTARENGAAEVRELMETVPENVRLAGYVPFDRLLPHADVLVTNGGYGGVHMALRHGVPMVVAGATEDKPLVAARVAWSGTGIDLRTDRPGEDAIRTAAGTVLAEPGFRTRARELGEEISGFDPLATIAGLAEGRDAPTAR